MRFEYLIIFIFLINLVSGCVDINSASVEELDKIIYIGEARAKAIIEARPFESIDDLIKVRGIGEKILEKIKKQGLVCEFKNFEREEYREEDNENNEEYIELNNSKIYDKIILSSNENIIKLNTGKIESEVVYESKNEKIKNLAIYGFCLFLIFIIAILLLRK